MMGAKEGELGAFEHSVGGVDVLDIPLLIDVLEADCASWNEAAWNTEGFRQGRELGAPVVLSDVGAGSQ